MVPAVEPGSPIGVTKTISCWLTDFKPQAAPLIVKVTPLNSIGKLKLLKSDPVAVRATTGRLVPGVSVMIAIMPFVTPWTAGGVCGVGVGTGVGVTEGVGVGLGVGVGVGVGVGLGVGVGVGVGTAVAETGILVAPVA